MIDQVKFVGIPVKDQQRSLEFFRDRLGFRVLTDQPFDDNQRWIELEIPGAETGLVLFTPEEHRDHIGTFSHVSFWAADVEKTYEELVAKGVEFVQPLQKADWGTAAIFKDPDGNVFVLGSK